MVPPICRVVQYAEFYYAEQVKRQRALGQDASQSSRIKTVRLRKAIDPHDLSIKVQHMKAWLRKGWSVRVVYFEKQPVEEERMQMMQSLQQQLQGAAVALDLHTKTGQVLFEPERKQTKTPGGAAGGGEEGKAKKKGKGDIAEAEAQVVTTRIQQQQSPS